MTYLLRLSACLFLCVSLNSLGATLISDSLGNLLGADSLSVEGISYDVRFVDGSCDSLFSGCDESEDFIFSTEALASLASYALLSSVFVGAYDDIPSLTNGIEENYQSWIHTPFSSNENEVFAIAVKNTNHSGDLITGVELDLIDGDFSTRPHAVYAVWSPSPVPLPAGIYLFLSGFVGLGLMRGRNA